MFPGKKHYASSKNNKLPQLLSHCPLLLWSCRLCSSCFLVRVVLWSRGIMSKVWRYFASLGYILQTAREKTNSSRGIKLLGLAAVMRKATFLAFGHSLPARKDRKNEVFKTLVNIWGVIPGGNLGNTSFKSFVFWLIIIRWNFCTFFLVASKIVLFWLQAALNVLILPIGLPHTLYYPDWKILLNVCSCIYVYQIE